MCSACGPPVPPAQEAPSQLSRLSRALIALPVLLIRVYQLLVSPIMPPICRFSPSCSRYTLEALQRRGLVAGSILGCYRILRCNPFCRGGFDPVPAVGLRPQWNAEEAAPVAAESSSDTPADV